MNVQRYTETKMYRNTGVIACQVSLAVLLIACGNGSDQPASTPTDASGKASVSAAQLADENTTTLSIAQATNAGLAPVQTQNNVNTNDLSITNTAEQPSIAAALAAEQPTASTTTPVPDTESEPTLESVSQLESVSESTPDTTSESASETTSAPEPVSTTEPESAATPETASEPTPEPVPVSELAAENESMSNESAPNVQTEFVSNNTADFKGEVLADGVVKVTWDEDPTARGYNIYRAGEYVDTVFGEEYLDKDTFDESYYYEVQAFDNDENYNYIALGLTVNVTGTGRTNPDSPKPKENILDGYELVFSDEFNGTELDSSKWVTQYLWGDELVINSEEQHYVDIQNKPDFGFNPFSFDGESVTISSIRTPDNLLEKAFGQKYLSGVMTSYDSFKFTYGYVETRAQLPFGRGLWPAFWLLNAYYVDDKPEIDIMEFIGHNQDTVYHTYHYYDSDGNLRSTESEGTRGSDWTNGWHTYAVEWLPGQLIFYVDGIEQHRVIDSKVSQQEMYILANTALGGWWPGSPDETTTFPAQYKIDYIRAYQKADSALLNDPNEGQPSKLLLWDDVPNVSPNHIPPYELWPQGYPERQSN